MTAALAAAYAALQFREMKQSRILEATMKVIESLSTVEAWKDRLFIDKNLGKDEVSKDSQDYEKLWRTWSALNWIGLLICQNLIIEGPIMELYHPSIITLWHKLWPHIERERNFKRDYMMYFQDLTKRSWKWHKNHRPGEKIVTF